MRRGCRGVRLTKPKSGRTSGERIVGQTRPRARRNTATAESLESTLRFTQFAVDNLSDAAYWIEQDARITYVNDAACGLTGYPRDELLGMHIHELNPDIPPERWPEVWLNLKQAGKRTFETRHRRKDGGTFPVEIAANFLEFDGKEYSCAFARDITDRRQLESRLRHAEKMEAVGQLAGGIAHDFNNQLMGIMGYADVLNRRLADAPELSRLAMNIRRSVLRAAELTTQLLALSRRGSFVSEPVDLHRIVGDVIDILAHTLDKRIVIQRRLDAGCPFTLGDATQLQSAVLNLALNARDAMPEGGALIFTTTNVALDESFGTEQLFPAASGEYVRLTVSDTGEGMTPETQSRVFEPFFTTKSTGKGTGLGLAAVYGTIKTHRGTLRLASELGQGTEIEIFLPATGTPPSERVPAEARPESRLQTIHVLLIEDEAALRDVTQQILEDLGCRVTSFQHGAQAVSFYERSFDVVDLVMLDMVMPVMNGREAFAALHRINPRIRALLTSGYSVDEETRAALEHGAKAFLQKPYDSSALAKKIVEVLEDE